MNPPILSLDGGPLEGFRIVDTQQNTEWKQNDLNFPTGLNEPYPVSITFRRRTFNRYIFKLEHDDGRKAIAVAVRSRQIILDIENEKGWVWAITMIPVDTPDTQVVFENELEVAHIAIQRIWGKEWAKQYLPSAFT